LNLNYVGPVGEIDEDVYLILPDTDRRCQSVEIRSDILKVVEESQRQAKHDAAPVCRDHGANRLLEGRRE